MIRGLSLPSFRVPRAIRLLGWLLAAWLARASAPAQVVDYTLGIDVNCRAGLRECWVLVNEGLSQFPGGDPLCQWPDFEKATCRWVPNGPKLVAPQDLSAWLEHLRIGARLRGLSITADGTLRPDGGGWILLVPGLEERLELAPLSSPIERGSDRGGLVPPLIEELDAYGRLLQGAAAADIRRVRVQGPLRVDPARSRWHLEVRSFQWDPVAVSTVGRRSTQDPRRVARITSNPTGSPPSPPSGLRISLARGHWVLDWDPHSEPWVDGYNVFRADSADGEYVQIAANVPKPRFEHLCSDPKARSFYTVTAVDRAGKESDRPAGIGSHQE